MTREQAMFFIGMTLMGSYLGIAAYIIIKRPLPEWLNNVVILALAFSTMLVGWTMLGL